MRNQEIDSEESLGHVSMSQRRRLVGDDNILCTQVTSSIGHDRKSTTTITYEYNPSTAPPTQQNRPQADPFPRHAQTSPEQFKIPQLFDECSLLDHSR